MTKPPQVAQSDSSDHVTINDQHGKRQLELLMQMKCETSSSRSFAVAKVTFQKCVALCQSDTLSTSDQHISQLRSTDLSFTRTAQTNEAKPACAFLSQSSRSAGGQLIATPCLSPTRSHFLDCL